MYPFFNILGMAIPSYGTMMVLGAAAAFFALFFIWRKHACWQELLNFSLIALAGGIAGAFLLNAALSLPRLITHWGVIASLPFNEMLAAIFSIITGMVFYGGVIGGVLAMLIYARAFKVSPLPYSDRIAAVLPLAHAIGRVGCFLGGCCYGIHVNPSNRLSVVYPPESLGAPHGHPVLAIQLVEAVFNILLFVLLLIISKKRRPSGFVTLLYALIYAAARFVFEFFRGDVVRGVYGWVSTSQIISVVLCLTAVVTVIMRRKKQY